MVRCFKCLIFITLFCVTTVAQDIHFSQFYMSPLNLSPAMTGVMNYNHRFILNYRNQWAPALLANAYNTSSFSYDTRMPVGESDYFGVGGSLWGDVAGESNFGTFQARVSGSYSKYLFGNYKNSHYLVIGSDFGFTQRRVTSDDLRWPQQHDGVGGWDSTAASGESPIFDPGSTPTINYPDVSLGIIYFGILEEQTSFYGGFAFHHINQPNVSFLSENSNLYMKFTGHGGGEFPISNLTSVLPNFIVMFQGPHREYNVGASFRYKLGDFQYSKEYIQVGGWYRTGNQVNGGLHSDAAIIAVRFETGNYGIGLSYDMTTSKFRQAGTANGSFELSMNYYIEGANRKRVYCPTF